MRGKAGQPQIFRWIDDDDDDDVGSPYVIHLEHNIITKFEGGTTIRLSYMAHFAPWLRPIMNFNWHIYAYASTNSDRPNCRDPNGIVGRPSSRQLTQVTVNSVVQACCMHFAFTLIVPGRENERKWIFLENGKTPAGQLRLQRRRNDDVR